MLELGGKAPLVVLDDADLDEAVNAAVFGGYMNQGQICMSTERIIVDQKVADVFVEKLAERARSLTAGDPRLGQSVLGSLVSAEAANAFAIYRVTLRNRGRRWSSRRSVTAQFRQRPSSIA